MLRLKIGRAGVMLGERDPLAGLFPRQRAVVDNPGRFKALLCGRRAGKTEAMIRDLARGMMDTPGSANLYIALTIGSAVKIFWKPFRRLNDKHKWGFSFNESTHEVRHTNGSWLVAAGGDSRNDLEKYRGTPWKRVRVDECGAWRPSYLEYFVEEVVEPSFMDHDGDLWLAGTPTRQAFGYFYEATTGKKGYSIFHWTAEDNPHVNWLKFVHDPKEGLLARRGWTVDNSIYKREYLALWSVDPSELVYAFDRVRNTLDALPAHQPGWDYILGFDFGVNNACAYSVIASPRSYGTTIYTVETRKEHGMAPSQWAPIMNEAIAKWRPWKAVGDSGGLGKAFLQEYSHRYADGFPIVPADKRDRRGSIEIVSDMLLTGRKQSLSCNTILHDEWSTLQWDEKRENTAEGQDNDVSDADMYATKETPAFMQAANPPEPEPEGPSWARDDEEEDEPTSSYLEL